jgi:hypothetical protein
VPGLESTRIGLRFARSQRRTLASLIERLRSTAPEDFDVGLFEKALESAEQGEPLIVLCSDPREVEAMADGFVRWGIKRPALEALNG